jgi:hypothetical protein
VSLRFASDDPGADSPAPLSAPVRGNITLGDTFMSATEEASGPQGRKPVRRSWTQVSGAYGTDAKHEPGRLDAAQQQTGTGPGYNNWAGAWFLHPDSVLAQSVSISGFVAVQDGTV